MKNTPLIALALLTAASAAAQTNTGKSGLPYDRIAGSYSSDGDVRSTIFSGTALLGSFLVGGNYTLKDYDDFGTFTSKHAGLTLGYLVGTGDADVIFSATYGRGSGSGVVAGAQVAADVDEFGYGIAWRQRLNASLDYTFSYNHTRFNYAAGFYAGGVSVVGDAVDSVDTVGLSLRYAFSKSLDFVLGYSHGLGGGGLGGNSNTWSLSLGWYF